MHNLSLGENVLIQREKKATVPEIWFLLSVKIIEPGRSLRVNLHQPAYFFIEYFYRMKQGWGESETWLLTISL
ncbi:MAG: hypothetical protein D3922_14215 [Candidatus Electrothrix sp. AR1]|nr:hypothetical protein [Candidatus Electrothrix sp. AR1]